MAHSPPSDAHFQTKLFCSAQPIVSFFSFVFKTNNTAFREVVFLTGKNQPQMCFSALCNIHLALHLQMFRLNLHQLSSHPAFQDTEK